MAANGDRRAVDIDDDDSTDQQQSSSVLGSISHARSDPSPDEVSSSRIQRPVSCFTWRDAGNLLGAVRQLMTRRTASYHKGSTHLQSFLILDSLGFLVRRDQLARAQSLHPRLGALVEYKQECACIIAKCGDPGPFETCRVCPHMFSCNCDAKMLGTPWCPHIHVAYRWRLHAHKGDWCLYVHDYRSGRSQMRHLRAWLQGPSFMAQPREDSQSYFQRGRDVTAKSVERENGCRCDKDKICAVCDTCCCRYECSCVEFEKQHQNCQHVHWVAMTGADNRKAMFQQPPSKHFPRFDTDDPCVSDDVREDCLFALELQHELSYNLSKSSLRDTFDRTKTKWVFRQKNVAVTKLAKKGLCICEKALALQAGKRCFRCKICAYDYECSCEEAEFVICRHIHYVARKMHRRNEGLKDRYAHLQKKVFDKYLKSEDLETTAEYSVPSDHTAEYSVPSDHESQAVLSR